jgi:multisubunit Na+/H+ antiporter MnhG subunit
MGPGAVPEFVAGAMIIVGAWFVLLGQPLAAHFAYRQHSLFRRFHIDIQCNRQVVAAMRIVFVVVGAFLVAMGLLALIVLLRR